jgi:hypothetical protein
VRDAGGGLAKAGESVLEKQFHLPCFGLGVERGSLIYGRNDPCTFATDG